MSTNLPNGTHASPATPIQLSFTLPHSPQTSIYIHLTILKTSLLLFLTSATLESGSSSAPMGSFVYAVPNRANPSAAPLSTALYPQSATLDFGTRMAKVLARRTGLPTYVANSVSFAGAALGGTVEEEMEGFRKVLEVVMGEVNRLNNVPDGD